MKGLILAAGLGTRLRPLTSLRPKPALRVANRPLIYYALDNLVNAGVTDIGIVVSPATHHSLEQLVSAYPGITATYIVQDPPLGLAHAVQTAQPFLGNDDFVMFLGDNLFENGITPFVERFKQGGASAVLALVPVPDPRQLGVAVVTDGRITELVEKPEVPPSNLAIAGVYVFSKDIHDMIVDLPRGAKNEYQITDAIARLIQRNYTVVPGEVTGWWKDTGKAEDILTANALVLKRQTPQQNGLVTESTITGNVVIEAGAKVRYSTIEGPAFIGANARIEHATIKPNTTVEPHARVAHTEISDSIVGAHSTVAYAKRLTHSLIGEHTTVGSADAASVTIGDHATVNLPS